MLTGLAFAVLGLLILWYPQILVALISAALILFGLGMMLASWQFRRLHKQSQSRLINWMIRW